MTGGSEVWHMESRWLCDGSGNQIDKISSEYNQVWEAKGADAVQNPGKMVLLDGDGLTGTNVPAENELMSSPDTLKAFINYCAAHFPAKKYDLILWDHGGGPFRYAFAKDEHEANMFKMMSFSGFAQALRECDVTQGGKKFDFIDFDACLMSSIEIDLALADYTDFLIVSPETEPGYGQYYTGWLDLLGKTPGYDTFKLGRKIVDDFIDFYENGDGAGGNGTLSVIDMNKLMNDQELLTNALTSLTEFPEVFICANDFVADDAIYTLRKLGKRIPEDIFFCGFDDSPNSRIMTPSLTTVHTHTQIMAIAAMQLLISRIENPGLNYRVVHTETELIYRDSTKA
jgi:hypothetical protein